MYVNNITKKASGKDSPPAQRRVLYLFIGGIPGNFVINPQQTVGHPGL